MKLNRYWTVAQSISQDEDSSETTSSNFFHPMIPAYRIPITIGSGLCLACSKSTLFIGSDSTIYCLSIHTAEPIRTINTSPYRPFSLLYDGNQNILFGTDIRHRVVFTVDSAWTVSKFAGSEKDHDRGMKDGPSNDAVFESPHFLAQDAKTRAIYITDRNTIRRIDSDGFVITVLEPERTLSLLTGLVVHPQGYLAVSDTSNRLIKKVSLDGCLSVLAGTTEEGHIDGRLAQFSWPLSLALEPRGDIFICDYTNSAVRRISNGIVSTIFQVQDCLPQDLCMGPDGYLFVACSTGQVYCVELETPPSQDLANMFARIYEDGELSDLTLAVKRHFKYVINTPKDPLRRTVSCPCYT